MPKSDLEILCDVAKALEAAVASLKQSIAEVSSATEAAKVREEVFTVLTFEKRTGDRLAEYEVALKSANQGAKWERAFNVLTINNASIDNRYHLEGYIHSYWLYGQSQDRIYRQKLKQA